MYPPGPLDPAALIRKRWGEYIALLSDPEAQDDIAVTAAWAEFGLFHQFLLRALEADPEATQALVLEIWSRREELERILGVRLPEGWLREFGLQ
ncbi:hypothetical protein [Thermus sp.]|uniref:hypothetical protein n=1 Tax=Thermus sp. TaxID=275 RepID=UPI00307D2CE9